MHASHSPLHAPAPGSHYEPFAAGSYPPAPGAPWPQQRQQQRASRGSRGEAAQHAHARSGSLPHSHQSSYTIIEHLEGLHDELTLLD